MSNLQLNRCLKFAFQKVDQHAGDKWLIHDTKRREDNQLQSLKLPCKMESEIQTSDGDLHMKNSHTLLICNVFWTDGLSISNISRRSSGLLSIELHHFV